MEGRTHQATHHTPPLPSSAETPARAEERLETTELALPAVAFDDSPVN